MIRKVLKINFRTIYDVHMKNQEIIGFLLSSSNKKFLYILRIDLDQCILNMICKKKRCELQKVVC